MTKRMQAGLAPDGRPLIAVTAAGTCGPIVVGPGAPWNTIEPATH